MQYSIIVFIVKSLTKVSERLVAKCQLHHIKWETINMMVCIAPNMSLGSNFCAHYSPNRTVDRMAVSSVTNALHITMAINVWLSGIIAPNPSSNFVPVPPSTIRPYCVQFCPKRALYVSG